MTRGPVQCDVGVSYGLSRKGIPAPASFKRWAEAACKGRIKRADIAIRVVDEKEGRVLNKHYRGKDYATNVLTFVFRDSAPLEGDLARARLSRRDDGRVGPDRGQTSARGFRPADP